MTGAGGSTIGIVMADGVESSRFRQARPEVRLIIIVVVPLTRFLKLRTEPK